MGCLQVETNLLHLFEVVARGDRIKRWRVLFGWRSGQVPGALLVVMLEFPRPAALQRAFLITVGAVPCPDNLAFGGKSGPCREPLCDECTGLGQ